MKTRENELTLPAESGIIRVDMLHKIISGGQTGADITGLKTAKQYGIDTGGWMPYGWITQNGKRPEYQTLYNMKEYPEKGYKKRTWANVSDSDGTVRFASDFKSPGEICTLNAIKRFDKPYLDVLVTPNRLVKLQSTPIFLTLLSHFINDNNIQILNIAGNTEKTSPNISEFVNLYLSLTFEQIGFDKI